MQYLHHTIHKCAIIGANCLTVMKMWVDAAYGIHHNMKSHTGGAMSLGQGVIMAKLCKQKLNTKSSTEAELVGSTNYLPNIIWTRMFLAAQGYEVNKNIFYQDNQSSMKLEKNGCSLCGQKSWHIDIQYFL